MSEPSFDQIDFGEGYVGESGCMFHFPIICAPYPALHLEELVRSEGNGLETIQQAWSDVVNE